MIIITNNISTVSWKKNLKYIFVIDFKINLFNNNHIIYRDLSLMVKYETFNLCYMGSNPIGLKLFYLILTLFIISI
jgi:hypothetical protein